MEEPEKTVPFTLYKRNKLNYMLRKNDELCYLCYHYRHEYGISMMITEKQLDNYDGIVFIGDYKTREIYYANKKAREVFRLKSKESLEGLTCYQLTRGRTKMCSDCPLSKLKKNKFQRWEGRENNKADAYSNRLTLRFTGSDGKDLFS